MSGRFFAIALLALSPLFSLIASAAEEADLILVGGKVASVDRQFAIHEALAVKNGRLLKLGTTADVLKTRGPRTEVIELGGKMVLPGLIDSHTHPTDAAMTEFDHEIPPMKSIADALAYLKTRVAAAQEGDWIVLRQVFITRLKEQRYPTKAELDEVAPRNPVVYSTGHDASVNSLALKLSGIDKDFRSGAAGKIERDAITGEPTGILRSAMSYLKIKESDRKATAEQRDERLRQLIADYNSVGITGIIDRDASPSAIDQFSRLRDANQLSVRVAISHGVDSTGRVSDIEAKIREIAHHPLRRPDPMLRIIGVKTYMDGGMLTGSAYMREPWGVSKIYSIEDPRYRGILFIQPEVLVPMVRATVESGMQFTAHAVGDGGVHALLDAYEEVNKTTPIAGTRPCVTHSNFMSREAIDQARRLGAVLDIQPAWLYLDTKTLAAQFGYDRLRYFQPLKSVFEAGVIAGGGSDHMQKIGPLRSVNFYHPFLAMWVTITRQADGYDRPLHPEEALSREQALRLYTANNAWLMFLEDQIGTLEPGKLADFIVLDRDLLTCEIDALKDAKVERTYLGGKLVYRKE